MLPSVDVWNGFGFILLDLVQNRREDAPRFSQLIRAHEVDLTSHERVQNQSLVRVRQLDSLQTRVDEELLEKDI